MNDPLPAADSPSEPAAASDPPEVAPATREDPRSDRGAVGALLLVVANPLMWVAVIDDLRSAFSSDPGQSLSVFQGILSLVMALLVAGTAGATMMGRLPKRLQPAAFVAVTGASLLGLLNMLVARSGPDGAQSFSMMLVVMVATLWAVTTVPARILPLAGAAPQLLLIGTVVRPNAGGSGGLMGMLLVTMVVGLTIRLVSGRRQARRDAVVATTAS